MDEYFGFAVNETFCEKRENFRSHFASIFSRKLMKQKKCKNNAKLCEMRNSKISREKINCAKNPVEFSALKDQSMKFY